MTYRQANKDANKGVSRSKAHATVGLRGLQGVGNTGGRTKDISNIKGARQIDHRYHKDKTGGQVIMVSS